VKKRIIATAISFSFLMFGPNLVFSATHYVRSGATGANNGSDWNNAWTSLPTTFVRGDTYYIADGTYQGRTFNTAVSGTTYIYIKKATASDHGTNVGWDPSYGDGVAIFTSGIVFGSSYWDFNGQVGSGMSGHGFKIVMPNVKGARGIRFSAALTNVIIRHTEIDGSAGKTQQSHDGISSEGVSGVDFIMLRNVWVHDVGRVTLYGFSAKNWTVEYSVFQRPGANDGQHSEIWSCHAGAGTRYPDDWIVRYNIFTDPISTGGVMTSGYRWKVYGNVFTGTKKEASFCGNGIFGGWSSGPGGNHLIYNNTFVNLGTSSNNCGKLFSVAGGSGSVVKNNLFFNVANFTNYASTKSHNAFGNMVNPGESSQQLLSNKGSDVFVSYSSPYWQSLTDDLRLRAATTEGDSTIGSEYNTDYYNITRGADGLWDRGAYKYTTSVASPSTSTGKTPGPPSGISIITQ
jgi:hypothetical protein